MPGTNPGSTSPVVTPIFIGGCPRSGTTFLASVLGTAPGCVVTPESTFKNTLWRVSRGGREDLDVASVGGQLERQFRYRLWGLRPTSEFLPAGPLNLPELLGRLVTEYALTRGEPAPNFWIDHTPRNLRHAYSLLSMFPEARFVHIVRDGRAVASSVIPLDWGPNTMATAARWWCRRVGEGVVAEDFLASRAVVHRIRYEELVENPAETLAALSESIFGSGKKLELAGVGRAMDLPEYTRDQHALIGKAPDPSRAQAWRERLSSAAVDEFEFIAGGFLEHLGYQTENPAPKGPSMGQKVQRNLTEAWRGMRNSLRRRTRVKRGSG